ncbi:MAG: hypothetical protein LUG54_04200 [Clostridiales bacterium]|nr:hypothetical protein [Clostridiales bacterium]
MDNPELATKLKTDFRDRHMEENDINELPRTLPIDNMPEMTVLDDPLDVTQATVRDGQTGEIYTIRPNPMGRCDPDLAAQGQNSKEIEEDCGIASTAKGINDLYGKK